jgi:para-nitrobenzyl esterase
MAGSATGLTVETTAGKVRGTEIDDGILAWRGIPYAAPPERELRLRLPQPAAPWTDVRDATAFAAPALQPERMDARFGVAALGPKLPPPSEDCLYLNVTAPAGDRLRPVIVWIHGGGYQSGSGPDMAADGKRFVRGHDVVVVTINYRLGALGFLAVPGESPTGAFGLHDQIAALRWVRENIAAFGGDPDQVTIYGLSAGAKSVANLMASPPARGLFARAASSSGGEHVATPAQSAAVARRFFRDLGADPERIRDVSAAEILAVQSAFGDKTVWVWRPMIDGSALTGRPVDAIARGAAAGIPLLAQHCVQECLLYQFMSPDAADQAGPVLAGYFGPAGRDEIFAAYEKARPDLAADPTHLGVEIMTDERYVIPTTRLADAQAAHAPVWRSRYDGPLTGLPEAVVPGGSAPAVHGTDGMPIWNGRDGLGGLLHQAWGNFVRTGSPVADGLPDWPRYDPAARRTMIFHADGPHAVAAPNGAQYAAWDGRDWQPGTWWPLADS